MKAGDEMARKAVRVLALIQHLDSLDWGELPFPSYFPRASLPVDFQ